MAAHTGGMAEPGTRLAALVIPILALLVLIIALRWTFGTGTGYGVPHLPDPSDPTGDGLLTEVSTVPTEEAARVLRARLEKAGIRATLGRGGGGYRLLVFADDVPAAKLILREHHHP